MRISNLARSSRRNPESLEAEMRHVDDHSDILGLNCRMRLHEMPPCPSPRVIPASVNIAPTQE